MTTTTTTTTTTTIADTLETPKLRVGILGCTGMVGQRFVQLLAEHPQFRIHALGASERSAGKPYGEACRHWKMTTPIPLDLQTLVVQPCKPEFFSECHVVFSGLDSSVAREIEGAFRSAELPVFSNAKNYRMDVDVPLVVPLVNADHLEAVRVQRRKHNLRRGFLVTNANCSTTGLVVALKPLHDTFGIQQMQVTTLQAISGAGYPGISALDILQNVVPYIDGEELKLEQEPCKILGKWDPVQERFLPQPMTIDATCNRVPVLDGHTECVNLRLQRKPESLEAVIQCLTNYVSEPQKLGLYSAPPQAIHVFPQESAPDRPQPRLDVLVGRGYAVSVGRLRTGNYWDVCFTMLSHNTILGAAGSSILNAELALAKGLLL